MFFNITHGTSFNLHFLILYFNWNVFVSINSYLINRNALKNRHELKIQNSIRKLGNAIKRWRYKKADKEKLRKYVLALLVLRYWNDPTKLKEEIKEFNKVFIKNNIVNNDDNNSSRSDVCIIVVHRATYAKHLRSKKHLENEKQFEVIIQEWLFQDLIENKPEQIYNPKSLKQIARESIKKYEKELAKKMINPFYFTDKTLQVGFNFNLES